MKKSGKNMSHRGMGRLSPRENLFAPVGPFTLQQTDDPAVLVGPDPVHATITAAAYVHPNLVGMFQLKQCDTKMLKCVRADTV
jgi:hypothetical protein